MTFLELAARCEEAAAPNRELDREIELAVMPERVAPQVWETLAAYTSSIDDAVTLVPEGFDWILGRTNDGLTIHAEVGGRGSEFMRFGNTPALALCAAALRARAALAGEAATAAETTQIGSVHEHATAQPGTPKYPRDTP